METQSLVKLAASGNVKSVEEAWLSLLEGENSPDGWRDRSEILKEMADKGHEAEAEAMAVMALESLNSRLEPSELLETAGSFLLALKNSDPLRSQVAELYRQVYGDVEGLEELLAEAGVEGGRPSRRALRTMEVCLQLREGMYLSHRHEDIAARVESIDRDAWEIDITTGTKQETLGAVTLADSYEPAADDDFRVMAQFDPDRLLAALADDPGGVVTNIVRGSGGSIDSDALERILCPRFVPSGEWTKWWTKARQALRLSPHVRIEGRSPYFMTYDEVGTSLEEEIQAKLAKAHDPLKELDLIEEYLRGCKMRKQESDMKLLERIRDKIEKRARRMSRGGKVDLTPWLAARRIGGYMEDPEAQRHVVEALRTASDPVQSILNVDVPSFWPDACDALEEIHPDNLTEALERLLPHAPIKVADRLAKRLVELGCPRSDFHRMAEDILRDPVAFNEGLLWLWNGPSVEEARVSIPLVTILTRILYALGELKTDDHISKERARNIVSNSRDALRARRYERFNEMLDQIEPGVAMALRTQINRLDNLARSREDMLNRIRAKFPQLTVTAPTLPKWLQDDVLYVTAPGRRRKREELDELVNVKIRENAIAIGRAAELGDLSENSEYKFALEERDLLQARLAQMNKEIKQARVLSEADVPTDRVGIGCRAVLEHVTEGARKEIVLLGPWEANHEKGVYNYKTPLAQAVLGTRVGESCKVDFFDPPGEYKVLEVSLGLPTGQEAAEQPTE